MPFDIEGARSAGYSDAEIAGFLADKEGFDLDAATKAGYQPADVIGFLSSRQKAAAVPDAGAGRGLASDPRRLDREQGPIATSGAAGMMPSPAASMPSASSSGVATTPQKLDAQGRPVPEPGIGDELGQLRDEAFSGIDQAISAGRNVDAASQARSMQALSARIQSLESAGEGDSVRARQLRGELSALQKRFPGVVQAAAESSATAQRGAQMVTRPAVRKVSEAKTFGEAWEAFKEAPYDVIAGVTAQSLPHTLPALITAAVAGPAAGAVAMGASSAVVEFGSSVSEFARENGVDPTQGEQLQAFLSDPQKLGQALEYAGKRAGIIATLDAASGGVASKTIGPVAARPLVRQAVNVPAQMGVQAAMGGAGEAGAQLATKGTIDQPGEVLMEAAGELGGAPMEVASFSSEALRRTPEQSADRVMSAQTVDEAINTAAQEAQAPVPPAATPRQPTPAAAAESSPPPAARPEAAAAVDNIGRILGQPQESPDASIPVGTPGQPASGGGSGGPDGVGGVLDGGLQPDVAGRGDVPARGAVGSGDAAVPAGGGDPRGAATLEPAATWVGRRGDGYATQEDAAAALPSRQRVRPDLDWRVEPTPEGRFRLAGYAASSSAGVESDSTSAAFRFTVNPSGTLTVQGDPRAIRERLSAAGVTQVAAGTSGVMVGRSQAQQAVQVLQALEPQVRDVTQRIQQLEQQTASSVDTLPPQRENGVDEIASPPPPQVQASSAAGAVAQRDLPGSPAAGAKPAAAAAAFIQERRALTVPSGDEAVVKGPAAEPGQQDGDPPATQRPVAQAAQNRTPPPPLETSAVAPSSEGVSVSADERFPSVEKFDRINVGPGGFLKPRAVAAGQPTYRETNLSGLDDRMREDRQAVPFNGFVADRPELALGQGDNRGVHIVFRPGAVSGREHSKPMTGDLAGREYRTDLLAPNAVQAVTLFPADLKRLRMLTRQRLATEFTRRDLPDGRVQFTRNGLPQIDPPPLDITFKRNASGTVTVNGDEQAIRSLLAAAGITKLVRGKNGLLVGKADAAAAQAALSKAAAPQADEASTATAAAAETERSEESADADAPARRRSDQTPTAEATAEADRAITAARSSRVRMVQQFVDSLSANWKDKPTIHVVESVEDMPGEHPADTRGMYRRGEVWIVASAPEHNTRAGVAKTLAHEAVAHYGLRKMLGREAWNRLMRDIQLGIRAKNKALLALQAEVREAYVDEDGDFALSAAEEADEIAARAVEQALDAEGNFRPGFAFLKAAFARVAQFLRGILGERVTFTNTELQGMLVLSMRNMERGERTAGGGDVVLAGAPAARSRVSALQELSEADELFAIPKSDKDTVEGIVADIAPSDFTVSKPSTVGLETTFTIRDQNGNTAKITARKVNPYGPSAYGLLDGENGPEAVYERPGVNPYDVGPEVEDVFINISEAKPGTRFGEVAYSVAANFAHNTGRIFIGDPAGLSDVAMRRRLEQMISSALKFGTTAHLAPHPSQAQGDRRLGIPALRWVYGDHEGNVERMIQVSQEALAKSFPKANLIAYDPADGTFYRTDTGARFTERAELARVVGRSIAGRFAADGGTGRAGQAGWRTLARAALLRHLQASAAGEPGQRGRLLDRLRAQRSLLGRDPATGGAFEAQDRIFYARGAVGDQTQTTEFKRWFGDSKVVDAKGKPLVLYHGTTADFDAFDRERANPESDFGAGFYFTNTPGDVANNYAGVGPDLTQKIQLEAERIASETDRDYSDPEVVAEARAKWVQHEGATVPVFLKMENPAIVGGKGETLLQMEQATDEDGEFTGDESGTLVDFIVALRDVAGQYSDGDVEEAIGKLMEEASYESIGMEKAIEILSSDEQFGYFTDDNGALVSKEIIRQALQQAGFDGVIDRTVDKKFGSQRRVGQKMKGMTRTTVHYIAFEPEQIKSAIGNRGTFDPFDGNIMRARGAAAAAPAAAPAPAPASPTSPWRDPTGRLQFAPGAWLYEKLGTAAGPLLTKLQLKAASPKLRRALREMKLQVQQAQDTAAAVASEAMKLSEDERSMVSDLIEQELAAGTVPPAHAVRLAAMINSSMGAQTDELVRLGMLSEDSAEMWRGKYLPRYYRNKLGKQVGDAWADAVGKLFGRTRTMAGIKGKHLRGRGLYENVPASEVAQWEDMGWEVRDPDHPAASGAEISQQILAGTLAPEDQVQVWRDFTREERENMGEIRDAGFRFVMGYMQTQRDIALGRLFEQLAGDAEMSSKKETPQFTIRVPDGTVTGTGAKRYGKLAGRWVSKDTFSHLTQIEESQSEAWKMYRKALALWKEGRVALNPVSHVNNMVSNLTMAHFAGVSYLRADKYIAAARDFAMKAEGVKEAKEAGLFLGTMSDAELMNVLPEDLKALVKQQDSAATKIGRSAFNVMTFFLRRPMGWAYQAEDTFFRYLIYKDARSRGMEPGDAVDYAQRYIFAYDDLPKGARMIRDFGIPFFAYTYKAVPALLHTALTHPVRMAAPAAVLWGINAAAYAIATADDDDDWLETLERYIRDADFRAEVREKEKLEREHLPPWMKGSTSLGTPKAIRLGMDEVTKLPLFIDTSRIVPGGDLFDVNPNGGGIPWIQPITPSNPLLTTYMAMFGNKDAWFGKEIVDTNDTRGEAAAKRAEWLWRQASPAVAFGNYHFQRGMQALAQAMGEEVRWLPEKVAPDAVVTGIGRDGLPVQPKYAAMQTFGLKVRPIDLEKSEDIQESLKDKLIRDIDTEMRRLQRLNRIGAISDSVYDREHDRAKEKKDRLEDGLTVDGDKKD